VQIIQKIEVKLKKHVIQIFIKYTCQENNRKWDNQMLTNKTASTPAVNRKPLLNQVVTEVRGISRKEYGPSES
jgi:hypothetical protein